MWRIIGLFIPKKSQKAILSKVFFLIELNKLRACLHTGQEQKDNKQTNDRKRAKSADRPDYTVKSLSMT